MKVERRFENRDMRHIAHALGHPFDPMGETYRNYFCTNKGDPEFVGNPHWNEGKSDGHYTYFFVSDKGRKALAAALAEREADGGWCADMENAPDHNGAAHFRAVEVLNNKTGQSHWDLHYGYIHDETGDFVDAENGDPFGWNAEDYTHFQLITLPPAKETE